MTSVTTEHLRFQLNAIAHLIKAPNLEAGLKAIPRFAVPQIADGCAVDLLKENNSIERLAYLGPLPRTRKSLISSAVLKEKVSVFSTSVQRSSSEGAHVIVPILYDKIPVAALSFFIFHRSSKKSLWEVDLEKFFENFSTDLSQAIVKMRLGNEAAQANRARDEFLSMASHELRNPIQALKLQAQLARKILETESLDQARPKLLSLLISTEKGVDRHATIINNLLKLYGLEDEKSDAPLEQFDLVALIKQIVKNFQDEIRLSKCSIEIIRKGAITGWWDRVRIEQIVTNLLANALKYGSGTKVTIGVQVKKDTVRIWIQDLGKGIGKKDQKRIFKRSVRIKSTTMKVPGLGLGLYIVCRMLEHLNGKITLKSEIGKGSRFTVQLPLNCSGPING